jgi:hypothetical protein
MMTSKSEHVTRDYFLDRFLELELREEGRSLILADKKYVESYADSCAVGAMPLRKLLANTSNNHFNCN